MSEITWTHVAMVFAGVLVGGFVAFLGIVAGRLGRPARSRRGGTSVDGRWVYVGERTPQGRRTPPEEFLPSALTDEERDRILARSEAWYSRPDAPAVPLKEKPCPE